MLSAGEKAARFAGGYVRRSFQKRRLGLGQSAGDGWLVRRGGRHDSSSFLPFERKTWEFAAEKGDEVATVYWRHAWPYHPRRRWRRSDVTPLRCSSNTGGHRRRLSSCKWRFTRRAAIEPGLLMDALETWLESETGDGEAHQGISFQIQLLFQELQRRAAEKDRSVDLDRLATLEWAYLGLLDGHPASPVTLHAEAQR